MQAEEASCLAIVEARLIDGTGAGPVERATILIEDSRIKAVGRDLPVPPGAHVIRAGGKTVMPGLIDAHMHNLGLVAERPFAPTHRPPELGLIKAIADAKRLLEAGYTTVKDCGGKNGVLLREAVKEGSLSGIPRVVAAGLIVTQTFNGLDNPHLPSQCLDARLGGYTEFLLCDGLEECRKGTRYALRYGADFVKVFASGNYAFQHSPAHFAQLSTDELRVVVETAAQAGKWVTAHCHNRQSAESAILSGVKTIDHALGVDERVAELAREHRAIFVSSLTILHSQLKQLGERQLDLRGYWEAWESAVSAYQGIRRAGAVLAAGSDLNGSPALPLGVNALELQLLVEECGFTPMEAITAATRNGAAACFLEEEVGTIEPGKLADLIAVEGDPLADIRVLQDPRNIKLVMLEGRVEVDRGQAISVS